MDCDKYGNQINDYLDNQLNKQDKLNFENYLNKNLKFKKIVEDIRCNDLLLKQIPKMETKSDFILSLNHRIDLYENSKFSSQWFKLIKRFSNRENGVQLIGVFSIIVIVSFTMFKVSELNFSNFNILSDRNEVDTSIAVSDADSLSNINNDTPLLLIGNEK